MERQHKIFLIVTGAVLLAGIVGLAIYQLTKKDDTNEEEPINDQGEIPKNNNTPSPVSNSDVSNPSPNQAPPADPNMVVPRFNVESELINPISELKDHVLYPKRVATGGWGYANVRSTPEVNTEQAWWDPFDNLLTTISSGTSIGRVISHETKVYNGYNYRWFKVKLTKPTGGVFSPYTEGYVRADTVTFKQYRK